MDCIADLTYSANLETVAEMFREPDTLLTKEDIFADDKANCMLWYMFDSIDENLDSESEIEIVIDCSLNNVDILDANPPIPTLWYIPFRMSEILVESELRLNTDCILLTNDDIFPDMDCNDNEL